MPNRVSANFRVLAAVCSMGSTEIEWLGDGVSVGAGSVVTGAQPANANENITQVITTLCNLLTHSYRDRNVWPRACNC